LIATSPARGLTPVTIGAVTLTEPPQAPVWAILPRQGTAKALDSALQKAHGLTFPNPGMCHEARGLCLAWSGLDQAFLIGSAPDKSLGPHAALIDQSDAWTHLWIEGEQSRAVLARLVPIDLSPAACPKGSARRTLLGHMPTLILHPGGDRFEVLVFRSMAHSAVHDLTLAMTAVAARRAHGV
jgi:sarcosine oxidase subunit gamma